MRRFLNILFISWFLLLPFSILSAMYFPVFGVAVDKALAPVLLIAWVVAFLMRTRKLAPGKAGFVVLVFSFFVMRNLSFIADEEVLLEVLWLDAILFGYFLIPFLYVDRLSSVDATGRLIGLNATVACISAFLVAAGFLELPYERFAESRIGFEDIKKSVGVVTAYGDVAQMSVFFLLMGAFLSKRLVPWMGQNIVRVGSLVIVLLGLIGNQSRSFLLSILMAYFASWFFVFRSRRKGSTLTIDVLAGVSVLVFFTVVILFDDAIIAALAGLGGREAAGTAGARLLQYQAAFKLISEHPILGISAEEYRLNPYFAHGIHNLWLGQLTRGGMLAAILLVVVIALPFKSCISLFGNPHTESYGRVLIGYLTAVMVTSLFYPADSEIFWALFGACSGMIYVLKASRDNGRRPQRSGRSRTIGSVVGTAVPPRGLKVLGE